MTVDQLHKLLTKAKEKGKGAWPVELMVVEDGVTMAQEIVGGEIARSYDGERVWLWPEDGIAKLPDWIGGGKVKKSNTKSKNFLTNLS